MVHSCMSPHLFEQNSQNPSQPPPASPTKLNPCTLPKLEYFQPTDSAPLAHSFKNIGVHPHSSHFGTHPPSASERGAQISAWLRQRESPIWSAAPPRRF